MAIDHRLRCKHCYGVINSDIYSHLRVSINHKTFTFCEQKCLDAYLERCGDNHVNVEQIAKDGKKKALKNERVKNRWQILDL